MQRVQEDAVGSEGVGSDLAGHSREEGSLPVGPDPLAGAQKRERERERKIESERDHTERERERERENERERGGERER